MFFSQDAFIASGGIVTTTTTTTSTITTTIVQVPRNQRELQTKPAVGVLKGWGGELSTNGGGCLDLLFGGRMAGRMVGRTVGGMAGGTVGGMVSLATRQTPR